MPKQYSAYDHATKAGNQGDMVKHPALVAALRGLCAGSDRMLRDAESFAGSWECDLRRRFPQRCRVGFAMDFQ